jgi:hypothetical protein
MTDETQEIQGGADVPEATPVAPVIDHDVLADKVAERLRPPVEAPRDDFDELDYDARDRKVYEQTQTLGTELNHIKAQQTAFMRSDSEVDKVLQLVPEHLRGEAKATVKSYIGQIITQNPEAIAQGLTEQVAKEIAGIAFAEAYHKQTPRMEPSAQVKTDDIPFADEIRAAYKERYNSEPSTEELKRRSETWGKTRAS